MNQRGRSYFFKVLLRFVSSYLLCLLIPVVILNVALYQAREIATKNAEQACVSSLSYMRDYVDAQLRFIDVMASQLLLNKDIVSLQYLDKEKDRQDHFTLYLANRRFERYSAYFDFNVYLYYGASGVFLTSNTITDDIERYYGISYNHDDFTFLYRFGDYTYEEFKEIYASGASGRIFFPSTELVIAGITYHGMIYARTLVSPSAYREGAYIYFIIEDNVILNMLSSIYSGETALLIYDASGNLLLEEGSLDLPSEWLATDADASLPSFLSDDSVNGGYIATNAKSDYGLQYRLVIPKAVAYEQVSSLNTLVWTINVAAIILTIICILALNYRNSKSLVRILTLTGEEPAPLSSGWNGIYDRIANTITALKQSNLTLSDKVRLQNDVLCTTLIERLFNGSLIEKEELRSMARQLSIPIEGAAYCVILVQFPDSNLIGTDINLLDQFSKDQPEVLQILQYDFADARCFFTHLLDGVGILCCLDGRQAQDYRQYLERCVNRSIKRIYSINQMTIRCAASHLFYELNEVYFHFNRCRQATVRQLCFNVDTVVQWPEILNTEDRDHSFVFSDENETKLINHIKAGDREEAGKYLAEIIRINQAKELSPTSLSMFVTQLKTTLYKSLGNNANADLIEKLMNIDFSSSYTDLYRNTGSIVDDICGDYQMKWQKEKEHFKLRMKGYIDENYKDPNLSLRNMADTFKFSENYFSQLFRELTGVNFSAYLEKVRMREADALIRKSRLKVGVVAKLCGYSATSTFTRAYKRYYGISPSVKRNYGE